MTAPEDDLEKELRQALAAALNQVQPGAQGLGRIRAKIGTRPPRPWLLSVVFGIYDRARNWTWRGHWAWTDALASPATLPWPRLLRLPQPSSQAAANRTARVFPPVGADWLRPVAVLAGVAIIASISLGVQPFRQAIIQASNSVLSGDGQRGGAGTDGNGTPAGAGNGASSAGGAPGGAISPGRGGTTMTSNSSTATPTSPAGCATITAELTNAPPTASAADASSNSVVPKLPSTIPSALPYSSPTSTCAAPTHSDSPSPTVSSGSSAASPTPSTSGASPTTSATPASSPSASPLPTSSATPSATVSPTDSPTAGPTPTDSSYGNGTDTEAP